MKISVYENGILKCEKNVGNKAENFYMGVSQMLIEYYQDITKHKDVFEVEVRTSKGNATYLLTKSHYSLRIFEVSNNILFEDTLDFPKDYHLEMIGVEHNNYKYYDLKRIGYNQVSATWGRIAPRTEMNLRQPYTYQQAYMKLGEKLAKGYRDMSFKIEEEPIKEINSKIELKDTLNKEIKKDKTLSNVSQSLYYKLLTFSKNMVRKTFQAEVVVTETMVKKATKLYNKLLIQDNVKSFNEVLLEIMLLAPRRIDYMCGEKVSDYMAKSVNDFNSIIDREATILNSLQVVHLSKGNRKKGKENIDDFDDNFIVEKATDKEQEIIRKSLNNESLYRKIKNIYHIIPKEQERKFNQYVKQNNINDIKMLWHGSRNENWLSIILNSLSLNPNAIITGKMFGNGIYFANESDKSYGYTSGGRWNNEYSNTRFMGLYKCAYGKPYNWYQGSHHFTKDELKINNADCVHAHRGGHLYRDEIIFFDENAMCLQYLVEFVE